jgi:hypothetical protein
MQCIGCTGPVRTCIFAPEFASDRRELTRLVAILGEVALEAMLYHQKVGAAYDAVNAGRWCLRSSGGFRYYK